MASPAPENLPLRRIAYWESALPHHVYLTQPIGNGQVRRWTWAEAAGEARRMAAWLKSEGEQRGWPAHACIAILSKNCAHWILSDFAIWMAGYVSVPLYPTLTAESVNQILEHSEAKAVFVGKLDAWEAMAAGVPATTLRVTYPQSPQAAIDVADARWEEVVAATPPLASLPDRNGDELATIIYTSGTTGMPKGVMHRFDAFAFAAEATLSIAEITPQDRMLSYLPLSHVAERWIVEANSIRAGFQLYFVDTQETFLEDLRRARPTFFISVPRLWVKFQQGIFAKIPRKRLDFLFGIPLLGRVVKRKVLAQLGLDHVRFAGGGAAPMPPSLLEWYRGIGLEVFEGYGMTEGFGVSHASMQGKVRIGYVGNTYAGFNHRIAESGEVLVKAPTLMMGYYKEPEKTRDAITPEGWLRTGDCGEIDGEGRLRITGRVKEIFKTAKGKYVAPAPIEGKLASHSGIEAVCVAGMSHPQPFAIAILSPEALSASADKAGREALTKSLDEHVAKTNATLDLHEHLDFIAIVPDAWTVENGFITPTLKIKRSAIEAAYGRFFDPWTMRRKSVVWHEA